MSETGTLFSRTCSGQRIREAGKPYCKTCTVGADIALHSAGRTSLVELIAPEGLQALDDLVCSAVRCAEANAILELFPANLCFHALFRCQLSSFSCAYEVNNIWAFATGHKKSKGFSLSPSLK